MNHYYLDSTHAEVRDLLEQDKLSYAVLYNVLGGPVKKIVTDERRYIIAHTADVFPTWIWTPDDVTEEELHNIYQIVTEEFQPISKYRFNVKNEVATYLIRRFHEEYGIELGISLNLVAYECHNPKAPAKVVEGHLQQLEESDYELAVRLIYEAAHAIGDRKMSEEECRQAAKDQLARRVLFVWRDKAGKAVSFCDRNYDDHYAKISQCYTPKEERGKGYAAQLIYELCCQCRNEDKVIMLYADGDYPSSNRCYQKIGFELKGSLVTIQTK